MAKGKSGVKGGVAALEQSPSHLLHRALQRALDIYVEEFGEAGITQRQFAVLAAADEREGATQADLVRITGIDRSTLADMARRMIGKGLLERERSNVDARANAVRLTEAGREALAEARPKMAAADARLLKLISGGGRRATFVSLLRDLTKSVTPVEPPKPKPSKVKAPKAPKAGKPHAGKPHKGGGKKAKKKAA
ncbi:MAG TPA: MarR family transcriptional regulator [Phenylobacterium sp.]|jgi:DNA-binding MarR family transcriptional regulator|uniref:MarR family winged helix-turn-helix transcriptional regulator n=1 Tax=Phenylobacterium sp. TaxID=1871053 RepID=UPI002D380F78|nr:MarR family transcriptional regulator [Phenylobacterium sp.]HZZ70554.1 MarR family transcriptional regulator [Phenylobacterium sp.]